MDLWRSELKRVDGLSDVQVVAHAFERYSHTAAMFGSVDRCVAFALQLAESGVNEISCLIDFGVDDELTYDSLEYLNAVRRIVQDQTHQTGFGPLTEPAGGTAP